MAGKVSGYLTVYLSLVIMIILSLFVTLLYGAKSNYFRMESECMTDIGMNSIFAEYHRELFSQYNIFSIDSSYGTNYPTVNNVGHHLREYIEFNISEQKMLMPMEIENILFDQVTYLSDGNGEVFRQKAVEAIEDDYNISLFFELRQWLQTVENNSLTDSDEYEKLNLADEIVDDSVDDINSELEHSEAGAIEFSSPTETVGEAKKKGLMYFVIDDKSKLSGTRINRSELISNRIESGTFNEGNMVSSDNWDEPEILEKFLFIMYLLKYTGSYVEPKDNSAFSYQQEYILFGKETDVDNLNSMINYLSVIRLIANTLYLYSDNEKSAEAEAAALAATLLFASPELTEVVKAALIVSWAYVEGLYDIKTLLQGGKVPLIKTRDSWHYSLTNALGIGNTADGDDDGDGLSYENYIMIFMMLEGMDKLTLRSMDVVEADIRNTAGNKNFRIDGCISGVSVSLLYKSGNELEYEISKKRSYR